MASLVKKRGKLRWRGRVMVHGRSKTKWFPDKTKASERAAVAWEQETLEEMEREVIEEQNQNTGFSVAEWTNEYLDESKSGNSVDTYKEKRAAFKRFAEFYEIDGNFPVADISKDMCRAFLKEQNDSRSGHAANKDRKNLVSAWTWGMENLTRWDVGTVNPFQAIKKFKEIRQPRYVPPVEDFWTVYDAVKDQQDKAMLLTLLHLAARRTEVFRLKRSDLDFQNQRARIWTRKRSGGMEYDWLPMTTELSEALSDWWKARMEMNMTKDQHVFVCLHESNATMDYYGKAFRQRRFFMERICRRAGVEHFTFHAIRHLTASILFHKGYSVSHIQLVLRHKSPTTTERYLKSLGLEMVRDALESLSRTKVVKLDEVRNEKRIADAKK
jgi:integrase